MSNKLNSQVEKLYNESSNLDSLWYQREVQLNAYETLSTPDQDVPFSIIFEGVAQNPNGSLAIDIKLYTGPCIGSTIVPGIFDCQNGQIVNSTVVCDFNIDCNNGLDERYCGTCDFENGNDYCGWSDRSSGSYFWQRNSNGTLATNKPSFDHTFNNKSGLLRL